MLGAEVFDKSIDELTGRLRKRDISVVILAVNLADSLALAGRLIRLRQGTVHEVYRQEDFAKLPINTPWLYLYREKYPPGPIFNLSFRKNQDGQKLK